MGRNSSYMFFSLEIMEPDLLVALLGLEKTLCFSRNFNGTLV